MQHIKKIFFLIIILLIGTGIWFFRNDLIAIFMNNIDEHTLILYGNVDQRQIDLAFKDSEQITEILVEEGTEVQKGQVLARIDTGRLEEHIAIAKTGIIAAEANLERLKNGTRPEEIEQAEAAVKVAEANLEYAEAIFTRRNALSRQNAVSQQELEQAVQQLNVSRANLLLAQKSLQLAEIGPRKENITEAEALLKERKHSLNLLLRQLEDASLTSPCDSIINRRLMEVGEIASPLRSVFSLTVLSPKWVRAYIDETKLGFIQVGMKARLATDSHPENSLIATVAFISSVAEFTPKTVETTELRTSLVYEVRLYVEDSQNILRLGMPITVYFEELLMR